MIYNMIYYIHQLEDIFEIHHVEDIFLPGRQVKTPHIPNNIHDVQEKNLVDDIFDS